MTNKRNWLWRLLNWTFLDEPEVDGRVQDIRNTINRIQTAEQPLTKFFGHVKAEQAERLKEVETEASRKHRELALSSFSEKLVGYSVRGHLDPIIETVVMSKREVFLRVSLTRSVAVPSVLRIEIWDLLHLEKAGVVQLESKEEPQASDQYAWLIIRYYAKSNQHYLVRCPVVRSVDHVDPFMVYTKQIEQDVLETFFPEVEDAVIERHETTVDHNDTVVDQPFLDTAP